jgi:hypothetical protein
LRIIVSLLIVWHLTAIALAALSIPPSSMLVVSIAQRPPMQWYLDALYLNHGYHFFAPNPGPGNVIRYELFDERGGVIDQGEFPNRKEQWPRLWYHRHFMLADQAGLPQENDQARTASQQKYLQAYARHLLHANENAQMVRVRRVAHHPLRPEHASEGRKLSDPETYENLLEVTQRRSDLGPNATDQTNLWQGGRQQIGTRPAIPGGGGWTGGVVR